MRSCTAGGNQSRGAQLPPPAPTSTLLPPPFPPGNSPMRPPPSPRLTSPGGAPLPVGLHAKGVSLMEAGKWDLAVKAFGQALDNARGSACTKEAQYLAAVRLLKVSPSLQLYCQLYCPVQLLCKAWDVHLQITKQAWSAIQLMGLCSPGEFSRGTNCCVCASLSCCKVSAESRLLS